MTLTDHRRGPLKWSEEDEINWRKWKDERDPEAGNVLVRKYLPLVDYVVHRLALHLPHTVQKGDLKSLGLQGLLDALDKFDLQRGLQFETYANFRIRGAIMDGLRQNDWIPRSVRDKARKIEEAYTVLEQKKQRSVTDREISEFLGLSEREVNQVLADASLSIMISVDEPLYDEEEHEIGRYNMIVNTNAESPEIYLDEQLLKETLAEAIDRLPEKEKIVVSLAYFDDMTFTEIAEILDLSTSRISQLHSKAICRLKAALSTEREFVSSGS